MKENARPTLVRLTLVPTLRSEGRGIAKELTRGLLGGVPHPSSRRGADICVPEGSEARPASGHGVGERWLFYLFLGPLPGKFLVKAPSLARLIRGKRGLVCACAESSVQKQGQGGSEQIVSPCPLDGFLDPLLSLFPQAHHRQRGKVCRSEIPCSLQGSTGLGERTLLSELGQSTGRRVGHCSVQWRGAGT